MKRNKYFLIMSLILSICIVSTAFAGCSSKIKDSSGTQTENYTTKEEDTTNNKKTVEDQSKKAKESFAKLLQDKVWLCKNTDYGKRDDLKFLILDIDQDGIPEMLLTYGNEGSEVEHAVSVVTYDSENNTTNVEKLSASHGGYAGYLSDDKEFVIEGLQMGVMWHFGYKLENNQCKQVFFWKTNEGNAKNDSDKYFKLNDQNASEEEYNVFSAKLKTAVNKDLYEVNNENIKKYLGVEPETISQEQDNESISDYSAYKEAIVKGITTIMKEKYPKENYQYINFVNFTNGKLVYSLDEYDGLVANKADSSKYVLLSSNSIFVNKDQYTMHAPDNKIVAWAKLRDDGIYEIRGQYLFALQVNSDKNSIISDYNSSATAIDDSCILVYPDGTVSKSGKLNDVSYSN